MKARSSSTERRMSLSTPPIRGLGTISPERLPLAFRPLFVGDTRHGEKRIASLDVGSESIHSADRVQLFGPYIGADWIDKLVFNVDRDDPSKNDPRPADLHRGVFLAFQGSVRLFNTRHLHDLRRGGSQARHFEFVD